jgi:hypothetical protein
MNVTLHRRTEFIDQLSQCHPFKKDLHHACIAAGTCVHLPRVGLFTSNN